MATISSPGIGSGLDVNSIVTQLVAIERQPIQLLQAKATKIQTQISEYGKLKGDIAALRDAALKLAGNTNWGQTLGTSTDAAAVGVTVASGAAVGSYSVQVQSLASPQSLASGVFASSAATPGAGTLHIELGAWGAGQTSFTPKAGAVAVDISVAAGDTLAQVRDKINGANAGVTALILTDAGGSRLLLRSSASGAGNAFRTSVIDADGNNTDAAGLSALAYDTGAKVATQTQAAANAAATVDGLAITSPSNTLVNLVDGITLTLSKVTTGAVDINVVQDNVGLKKSVQDFADAYNALAKLVAGQIKYDAATKTAGVLQGDSTAVSLQRQMRALVGASSGASTAYARLSDAGIEMQADGSLNVNATKIDAAVNNLAELKKLFANSDILVPANDGFGKRFRVLGDSLLSVDGPITTRSDGLRKRADLNQTQQDKLTERVAQVEKRLRAQYSALDTALGRLNGLSSFVTQQITAYNNTNYNNR